MGKQTAAFLIFLVGGCTTTTITPTKKGNVEYIGEQRNIFSTGKAQGTLSLASLETRRNLYAIGPVEGLDGEITIFDSKAYVSKVRGNDYTVDHTFDHKAIFLVWTQQSSWRDVRIPENVKSYPELQRFVSEQALAAGIDLTKPFPFLVSGTPAELKWHVNVDRTEGQFITSELFAKSKASYVAKNEPLDIVGFYSDSDYGVFISQYAPAIKPGGALKNSIHIHLVSRTSKATGHVDDLTLGSGMVLRLPRQ